MLAKMTKLTPDLNGFVDRDVTEVRKVVAKAYRGTLSSDGKPVQIKPDWPPKDDVKVASDLDITRVLDLTFIQDAFHEQYIWSLLYHENIHPFLGILTTFDETVSTVAEWVDKGDAHSYVQNPNVDPSFLVSSSLCCRHAPFRQLCPAPWACSRVALSPQPFVWTDRPWGCARGNVHYFSVMFLLIYCRYRITCLLPTMGAPCSPTSVALLLFPLIEHLSVWVQSDGEHQSTLTTAEGYRWREMYGPSG